MLKLLLLFNQLLIIQLIIFYHYCIGYQLSEKLIIKQLFNHNHNHNNESFISRPIKLGNETIQLFIQLILQQIIDLDEKNQILFTSLLIQLKWIDQTIKLKMLQLYNNNYNHNNEELKNYFTNLVIPSSFIWTPDLYVYNNADDGKNGLLDVSQSRVRINQNGEVTWNLPVSIRSSCNIDVLYFPFDHQLCNIQLASWTYDQSQLQLNIIPMNITNILNKLIENVELAVPELKIFQNYRITVGGQNITQINLRIHIYRRTVFYAYTVIAPSILLCILTVFSFWLPSGNVKKIDIGLTVFLFLYFLQVMIAENTPESNSTPLIGTFLTMVMTLNSISLIFATIVLHIHIRSKNEPCPTPHPLLWYLITNIFGYLAMIPYQNMNQYTTNTTTTTTNHNNNDNNDYIDNDQFKTSLKDNSYDLYTLDHQRSTRDERTFDLSKRLGNTNDIVIDSPPLLPPPPPLSPTTTTTNNNNNNNNQYNEKLFFNNQYLNEINITRWLYIARVVDRLLFQIYLLTTIISIFVFLIYLPTSYDIKL
ncbi:unnamed protein product [Schistosoma rodhaini]|uniref:Neur_chan_LBD domain-containing protein n=1 Tax=Schistosoma rodhaini TaxID=6188 RepID=A0AA85FZS6_9TREM|nr:unnamed protein product [Schistosoma rodhaini]